MAISVIRFWNPGVMCEFQTESGNILTVQMSDIEKHKTDLWPEIEPAYRAWLAKQPGYVAPKPLSLAAPAARAAPAASVKAPEPDFTVTTKTTSAVTKGGGDEPVTPRGKIGR